MARMKLHKSVRLGAYEIYPIYEVNFAELKELSGYTLIESSDNVSPDANKFRYWSLINNDIPAHTNYFPRRATEDGNILPCDTRYNNLIDDRYYMPHDTLASFAAIEQGVQPEDWGVNPNYVTFNNITQSFNDRPGGGFGDVKVCIPEPVNIYDTWDASTSYYEDTQRFLVRKFFLEDGKSFAVSKAGYYNENRWRGISFGNGTLTSYRSGWNGYDNRYVGYYFTRSDGTVIDKDYRIEYPYGITGITSGDDANWPLWQNGKNITQFFIHYVENGNIDFYGIAMAQMDSFLETASPIALEVVAFDAQWWGASIIPGGGGGGQWTTDGPTSYIQGGQGSFNAPSDNHGDRSGSEIDALITRTNSNMTPFSNGYNKYVMNRQNLTPFTEMISQLWDPSLFQSYENHTQNPLAAIVSCNMLPENLASTVAGTPSTIEAAGAELSDTPAPMFDNIFKWYHVGDVDIRNYTDSFADYTATNIFIHLPYVGDYKIDTEAVMEGMLSVEYIIDMFTADITALIWTRDRFGNYNYRYEFKGNCGKAMPLAQIVGAGAQRIGAVLQTALQTGLQSATAQTFMQNWHEESPGSFYHPGGIFGRFTSTWAATKVAMGEGGGNTVGNAFAAQSLATGITKAMGASAGITQSNASGGALTSLINDQCYLTISRPQWSAPKNYRMLFGYPSDIGGTIEDGFEGFLSVRSIKLDNIEATAQEKTEITNLMYAGVYVSDNFGPEEE